MAYTGPDFVNGGPPAINAANLNAMVTELERCSARGDEVEDIRTGANGTTYSSAGNAVRGQVNQLNTDLSALQLQVNNQVLNRFDLSKVTYGKKTYFATGYKITNLRDQNYSALSEIIPCKEGDVITVLGLYAASGTGTAASYGLVFADVDDNIISYYNQEKSGGVYQLTAPANAVKFRFNVNINYSSINNCWCTVNNGRLDYAVAYGEFAVHKASENMFGGVKASAAGAGDTQEVKINNTDGKLYVNIKPASQENRQLFLPQKVYLPNTNKPKVWYRSVSWVRDMGSVYFKYPVTTTKSRQAGPEYLAMGNTTMAGKKGVERPGLSLMDASTLSQISRIEFDSCMLNLGLLTNPESQKNLLLIGDSFVNVGIYPDRVQAKLTEYGLTNVKMIGRKTTTNGTHHEGNGGHAYYDYITNPVDLESGHINPFWHDGGDDFAWYVSEYGDGATTLDYVIIHLGVNDMLDNTTAEQIVTNMTTFVGYIHADFPDAIVIIDGLVIPSMLCESYYNPVDQAKKVHEYNAIMEAGALAITNTFFAPVTFFFDAEHAYPYTMVAPSEGSTELVKRLLDSLHPYEPGYYQIADEALWCLLYNSSDF